MTQKRRSVDPPTMIGKYPDSMMRISSFQQYPKITCAPDHFPRPTLAPSLMAMTAPASNIIQPTVSIHGNTAGGSSGKRKATNPQKRPRVLQKCSYNYANFK